MSCPYKHILGVPGKGVHEARFLGISTNDTIMTAIVAALIAFIGRYSFVTTFLILFILGEYLHLIFGVQTAFLTMLGIKACD